MSSQKTKNFSLLSDCDLAADIALSHLPVILFSKFLRYGDYDEVAARIRAIKGIGEWSSHFILLRGLGRMERVSAVDRELVKAASHIYNDGQPLAAPEVQRLLDTYGTTQGYWAFYIRNATPERAVAMEMK